MRVEQGYVRTVEDISYSRDMCIQYSRDMPYRKDMCVLSGNVEYSTGCAYSRDT